MPSIISDYEYDIFISYRHKDNKGDHWVTEFVNALKTELETTFKEDISIYFDTNPHDGLLENHDVDDSLKGKLKCIIFIPIVSQTYCDPKSFAWKNEFLAFKKIASEDPFGLKIKVTNGNVASRILPVCIHELDPSDKQMLETELGGVLRGIEFIYRNAGVVRPLKALEDDPKANLNHTFYRDQINKVARGIKELIAGLQSPISSSQKTNSKQPETITPKMRKRIAWAAIMMGLLGLLSFAFYYFGGFRNHLAKESDKSIAVLPFENMNHDPEQDYFSNGIAEDILNHLTKISDLKVKSRTSTLQYKSTTKTALVIGDELGVSNIVEGSVRRVGDKVRIVVQLIDAKTDNHLWSETYDRDFKDVLALQSEIAVEIARALEARLTLAERENISKAASHDITAYDYFLKAREIVNRFGWGIGGNKSDLNSAMSIVTEAIRLDKNFGQAFSLKGKIWYLRRSSGVSQKIWIDSAMYYSSKAIALDPSNPEGYLVRAKVFSFTGKINEGAVSNQKAYEIAPNNPEAQGNYGWQILFLNRDEKGADMILKSIESQYQAQDPRYYFNLAMIHRDAGDLKGAEQLYLKARSLDPGSNDVIYMLYSLYERTKEYDKALNVLREGNQNSMNIIDAIGETNTLKKDYASAVKYYERYKEIESSFEDTTQSVPLRHRLAYVYSQMGRKKEAEHLMLQQLQISDSIVAGKRGIGGWYDLGALYYDRALCLAYLGKKDEAVASLDSGYHYGWRSDFYFHNDPLLANLQDHPGFRAVLKKVDDFTDFQRKAFSDALNRMDASKQLKNVLK